MRHLHPVARLRIDQGLSPNELAAQIEGISGQTIRRLEAGHPVRPATLKRIADHFGIAPSDLLGRLEEAAA